MTRAGVAAAELPAVSVGVAAPLHPLAPKSCEAVSGRVFLRDMLTPATKGKVA